MVPSRKRKRLDRLRKLVQDCTELIERPRSTGRKRLIAAYVRRALALLELDQKPAGRRDIEHAFELSADLLQSASDLSSWMISTVLKTHDLSICWWGITRAMEVCPQHEAECMLLRAMYGLGQHKRTEIIAELAAARASEHWDSDLLPVAELLGLMLTGHASTRIVQALSESLDDWDSAFDSAGYSMEQAGYNFALVAVVRIASEKPEQGWLLLQKSSERCDAGTYLFFLFTLQLLADNHDWPEVCDLSLTLFRDYLPPRFFLLGRLPRTGLSVLAPALLSVSHSADMADAVATHGQQMTSAAGLFATACDELESPMMAYSVCDSILESRFSPPELRDWADQMMTELEIKMELKPKSGPPAKDGGSDGRS